MSGETQYFRYVVAQYAHSRRDERLNVGVIVHDPLRTTVRSYFDTTSATRRIKHAFPDVDARGLTVFLRDLGEAVLTNPGLNETLDQAGALSIFAAEWRNAIQFTAVRSIPAPDITEAVARLSKLYVREIPEELHDLPQIVGVRYAYTRTRQALRDVLQLEEGLNYNEFREERVVTHAGKTHRYDVTFPFFVYEQFVIDALSFRTRSFRDKFNVASGFLQRVEELRKIDGGNDLVPCLSYVADDYRREETDTLVAQIQEKAQLPDERVVEAANAEALARFIGTHRVAA
jgi:hypothetical protein